MDYPATKREVDGLRSEIAQVRARCSEQIRAIENMAKAMSIMNQSLIEIRARLPRLH